MGGCYRRGRGLAAGLGPRVLSTAQQGWSQDDLGLLCQWDRQRRTKRQRKLSQGVGEEGDEELDLDWASESSSLLGSLEDEVGAPGRAGGRGGAEGGAEECALKRGLQRPPPRPQSLIWSGSSADDASWAKKYLGRHRHYRSERSLWSERYGHLPWFLQLFAIQSWFKKLFPDFNVEVWGGPDAGEAPAGVGEGKPERPRGRASAAVPGRRTPG